MKLLHRSRSDRVRAGLVVAMLLCLLPTMLPTVSAAKPVDVADARPSAQVQMPLVPGVAADPSITTHDGRYYLMYNKDGFADSIVMRAASSLVGVYNAHDNVVWEGRQGPADVRARVGLGSWLLPWNGRWYLYGWGDDGSSVTTSKPFVLESEGDDPLGPYRFKELFSSPLPEIGGDNHGYAASPIQVGNRLYLTQTSQGKVFLAELSNPWTLATGWSQILRPDDHGWECANGRCLVEGGSAVVRDGKVFLLFSAGGYESPDYCVGMATAPASSDLRSSEVWTKSDDCVFRRDDDVGAYGPASMTWFTSPDGREDWVTYHVKTTAELGGDRALQAKPVRWRPDGTPDLGQPLATGAFQRLPSGDQGEPLYEAERGQVQGGRVVRSDHASIGRYVALAAGDSLTFSVSSAEATTKPVYIWIRAEVGRPRVQAQVNGHDPFMVDIPVGGRSDGFAAGQFASISVPLRAGMNTIQLTGVQGTAGIDRLWAESPLVADGAAVANTDSGMLLVDVVDGTLTATSCRSDACEVLDPAPAAPADLVGYPGAVSRDGSSVDVFALGADGVLWQTAFRDGRWDAWSSRGSPPPGVAPGGVSVAARTANNLDVYVLGTDGRLWSTAWQSGGDWIGWFAPDERGYGVGQISAPAGVGRQPQQLDLASVGSDGHVWLTWWNGQSWNRSYPVGSPPGGATSSPAIASRTADSIDVVVRGADGNVWSVTYTESGGWGRWTQVPGVLPGGAESGPAVVSDPQTGALTATVRADDALWFATLDESGWVPWHKASS